MVGVPTSNRCDNCRKRKKKCGEQKPSCLECVRAGWTCPGYKTKWKFVDETSRLAEHYAGRKYVYDAIDLNLEEAYSRHADENMRLGEVLVLWKSEVPRYHEINPLASILVYCVGSKVKGTLIPLWLVGSFFDFIPSRLGRNAALDDAVTCLCAIYCGTPSTPYHFNKGICQSYVKALSSLRGSLGDTSLRMEPDTLCASILLQMCELVINTNREEWSHLARGTAFLLYSRGVHRYTSAFERAMLESQLSFVLGQSTRFKEHCFLGSPEWQGLLLQSPAWPFQTLQPRSLSLRTRLCGILVDFPSLVIHYSIIDANQVCQTGWEERLDLMMHKASAISDDVKKLLRHEIEPRLLSFKSSHQVFQEHTVYPDLISGVLDCVANMALLTLDKILRSLCYIRLGSSSLAGRGRQQWLESTQFLGNSEIIERQRQRVITAFKFVQGESTLAAKPLDFGLRQIKSSDSSLMEVSKR